MLINKKYRTTFLIIYKNTYTLKIREDTCFDMPQKKEHYCVLSHLRGNMI